MLPVSPNEKAGIVLVGGVAVNYLTDPTHPNLFDSSAERIQILGGCRTPVPIVRGPACAEAGVELFVCIHNKSVLMETLGTEYLGKLERGQQE